MTEGTKDRAIGSEKNFNRRNFIKGGIMVTTSGALAGCIGGSSSEGVVQLSLYGTNRSYSPEIFQAMQQVMQQWEQLGIQLDYVAQSDQEWIATNYSDKDYRMSFLSWGGDANRIDPLRYLGLYWSDIGGYNSTGYSNPEYDEAYQTLRTSSDRQERQEAAYECQRILCEDAVCPIVNYHILKGGINTDKFSGWVNMPGNIPYRNVWNLTSLEPQTSDTDFFQPMPEPPDQINPMALGGNVDNIYHRLVYDRLVRLGPDEGEPQPSSAEDWEFVDDTTVDVTLKEGLVFSDGEPVRPEDVKFTWDYFREHGQGYFATHFESFDTIEVTGDQTVRFNLKRPDSGLVPYSFYIMPIMPQHVWEGVTEEQGIEHPREWSDPDYTASGPFAVVEENLPDSLILEVNEDYHMDFNGIERFIVQQFGGFEQALGELENANAALVEGVLTNQANRIEDNSNGNWDHVEAFNIPQVSWNKIQFNMRHEPSNDRALRRACAHALNPERIIEVAYGGDGAIPGESSNPIAPHNEFWNNPDVKKYDGGPERGREILEEAGYRWDDQDRLLYPEDMLPVETSKSN